LIGICGIPGAGKSTIAHSLTQLLPLSVVLPMDGFHIMRNQLTEEGIKRRGAAFTFDLEKFNQKI
jgi:pantothenate kinase